MSSHPFSTTSLSVFVLKNLYLCSHQPVTLAK
nr:MAG TPA: hypothetical protein [Caudoviricetes sp.]